MFEDAEKNSTLVQRAIGRAEFLRSSGRVKDPEILLALVELIDKKNQEISELRDDQRRN